MRSRFLVAGLAVALLGVLPSAPAYAANPVTPGTFTGLGFDQCAAPSQSAMSAWVRSSPFRAAGIYISGNSRACRTQTNLTPTWVRNQLAAGWHLMPITLGPQASCSTRYPRYGRNIDPTIIASSTDSYAAARAQGAGRGAEGGHHRAGPRHRPRAAPSSTTSRASTPTRAPPARRSAKWFVHAWTRQLHSLGYVSGFYSSAASGIRMLDDARVDARQPVPPARPDLDRGLEQPGRHQLQLHPQRRLAALQPGQPVPRRPQRDLGRRDDQHRPQLPQPAGPGSAVRRPRPRPLLRPPLRRRPRPDLAEVHRHLDGRRTLHPGVDHRGELPHRPAPRATPA